MPLSMPQHMGILRRRQCHTVLDSGAAAVVTSLEAEARLLGLEVAMAAVARSFGLDVAVTVLEAVVTEVRGLKALEQPKKVGGEQPVRAKSENAKAAKAQQSTQWQQ